jgi:F-type H+-transporting ATPase subunit gamma
MSETSANLQRKIKSAKDLQSVVRTMKALAAANIGQYEKAVRSLNDYYRSVEMGLSVCFRRSAFAESPAEAPGTKTKTIGAVVFGSDQGLVGRFNDIVVEYAVEKLSAFGEKPCVWAVGERAYARLEDAGFPPVELFAVPSSVQAISPLVGEIVTAIRTAYDRCAVAELYLFYNRPAHGASYAAVDQRLLPLDEEWRRKLIETPWPTANLPELIGGDTALRELIQEYLFVSLFRACAESLASENASRLAAMQRADTNIDELLVDITAAYHRLRQSAIDEELFDVTAGFEALSSARRTDGR